MKFGGKGGEANSLKRQEREALPKWNQNKFPCEAKSRNLAGGEDDGTVFPGKKGQKKGGTNFYRKPGGAAARGTHWQPRDEGEVTAKGLGR